MLRFLQYAPDLNAPAIRALPAPWYAEQQRRRNRPFQVLALQFQVEPVGKRPTGLTFLIVWPLANGEGKFAHNANRHRTVMQARAGDVLVKGRERWRVRAVRIYRSFPVIDELSTPWCRSVEDAIWDSGQ